MGRHAQVRTFRRRRASGLFCQGKFRGARTSCVRASPCWPDRLAAARETGPIRSQARTARRVRRVVGTALLYASVGTTGAALGTGRSRKGWWAFAGATEWQPAGKESVTYLRPTPSASWKRLPERTPAQGARSRPSESRVRASFKRTNEVRLAPLPGRSARCVTVFYRRNGLCRLHLTQEFERRLGSTQRRQDEPEFRRREGKSAA